MVGIPPPLLELELELPRRACSPPPANPERLFFVGDDCGEVLEDKELFELPLLPVDLVELRLCSGLGGLSSNSESTLSSCDVDEIFLSLDDAALAILDSFRGLLFLLLLLLASPPMATMMEGGVASYWYYWFYLLVEGCWLLLPPSDTDTDRPMTKGYGTIIGARGKPPDFCFWADYFCFWLDLYSPSEGYQESSVYHAVLAC